MLLCGLLPLEAQSRPVPPGAARGETLAGNRSSNFFSRGFDLDPGPDFAFSLDGIPLNLPSALKAPGFLDRELLIPETLAGLTYRKGFYGSDQGAFAIAGSAERQAVEGFPRPMIKGVYGGARTDRLGRLLWAESRVPGPTVSYALEATHSHRPWEELGPSSKLNLFLRIAPAQVKEGWTFTLLGSTQRGDGGSPPLDAPLPPSFPPGDDPRLGDGFNFQRLHLGLQREASRGGGIQDRFRFHGGAVSLRHWATSTYFLRDPFWGDQQALRDRRWFVGGEGQRQWDLRGALGEWTHRAGFQVRLDQVREAEVRPAFNRLPLEAKGAVPDPHRLEARGELMHGTFHGQSTLRWGEGWQGFLGMRVDALGQHVHGPVAPTRGTRWGTLVSPRVGLRWSPWPGAQVRAAWGQGFRPGNAFREERPVVRAHGADLGLQLRPWAPWVTSLVAWTLDLEAEAVFDPAQNALVHGDPSRRRGLEWFNEVRWGPWKGELNLDWSRARFHRAAPGEARVPGSQPRSGFLRIAWEHPALAASVRYRTFGAYVLDRQGKVESGRQRALELRLEVRWKDGSVALEACNAFSLRRNNRAYFYESRLPHEDPVHGTHTKRASPQALRVEILRRF